MKQIAFAIVIALAAIPARGHEELRRAVIVDTDMALDDARALALLLTSPSLDVRAIVTSDGASSPAVGATNVLRILQFLGKENIPVGIGRSVSAPPPRWREQSETLGWKATSLPVASKPLPEAVTVLREAVANTQNGVTYLCLGPLSNLADALRTDPRLKNRLWSVIWHGADSPDWNADRDAEAVRAVKKAGVTVRAVAVESSKTEPFDAALLEEIRGIGTPAARLIARLHEDDRVQKLVNDKHLQLWDDTTALMLLRPSLETWDRAAYLELLRAVPERDTVVIEQFPTEMTDLQEDVRPYAQQIITRYGVEEWKAALLTSELHRHLGTYSIIGAKMGIRARELLGASLDELSVESHAGLKPPLSCLNDGLQVSTGASLGRGTIKVLTDNTPRCEAVFVHGNKILRLRLKPNVASRITSEIATLVKRHGGITPAYFRDVRIQSLGHWLELDRGEIFEEVTGNAHP
jgi:pyrimidine-specific ribonucleoside hydrolase